MSAASRIARRIAVVVGLLWALSACSSSTHESDAPQPSPLTTDQREDVDPLMVAASSALEGSALAPDVRDIIENTVSTRELTYQDFKRGLGTYVDCMAGVGVEARMFETTSYGVPTILFGERFMPGTDYTDDQYQDLRGECAEASYFPLSMIYDAQPSSVEAMGTRIEQYRGALTECLRPYGVELAGDAGFDEVSQAVSQVLNDAGVACDLDTGFVESQMFPDDFWD